MPGASAADREGLLAIAQVDGPRPHAAEPLLIELQAGQIVARRVAGRAESDVSRGHAVLVAARLAINPRRPTETHGRRQFAGPDPAGLPLLGPPVAIAILPVEQGLAPGFRLEYQKTPGHHQGAVFEGVTTSPFGMGLGFLEIPEHLLKRSRERRSALGLGGDDAAAAPAAAATPATTAAAAPAAAAPAAPAGRAAAPAAPAAPKPKPDSVVVA